MTHDQEKVLSQSRPTWRCRCGEGFHFKPKAEGCWVCGGTEFTKVPVSK